MGPAVPCRADPVEDPSRGTSAVNTRQTSAPQKHLAQLCVSWIFRGVGNKEATNCVLYLGGVRSDQLSHYVKNQAEVRDAAAVRPICHRLGLPALV